MVEAAKIEAVILDDPDDDNLISCAFGGSADYIVSGDHHLLDLVEYQNIKMWTVTRFLSDALES